MVRVCQNEADCEVSVPMDVSSDQLANTNRKLMEAGLDQEVQIPAFGTSHQGGVPIRS